MTPDRLARMVEREKMNHLAQRMPAEAVLKLLRRQQQQFMRLVKAHRQQEIDGLKNPHYLQACEQILDDLAALQRGRK